MKYEQEHLRIKGVEGSLTPIFCLSEMDFQALLTLNSSFCLFCVLIRQVLDTVHDE